MGAKEEPGVLPLLKPKLEEEGSCVSFLREEEERWLSSEDVLTRMP